MHRKTLIPAVAHSVPYDALWVAQATLKETARGPPRAGRAGSVAPVVSGFVCAVETPGDWEETEEDISLKWRKDDEDGQKQRPGLTGPLRSGLTWILHYTKSTI